METVGKDIEGDPRREPVVDERRVSPFDRCDQRIRNLV
jgi:hypothetical protein